MILIPDSELQFNYIHSSGPGGQNINKVTSGVELRFDVFNSISLPSEVKVRLLHVAGKRISKDGILVIQAKRYRLRENNRQDAIRRLLELVDRSVLPQKIRQKTKPGVAARQKRLDDKKLRGEIKKERRKIERD